MAVDRADRAGVRARSSIAILARAVDHGRRQWRPRRSRLAIRASRSKGSARPAGAMSPRERSR